MSVQGIFGAWLYTESVDLPKFDSEQYTWQQNKNNWITESQNILDHTSLQSVHSQLKQHVHTIWREVLCASCPAELEITQSWINRTLHTQSHHRHWHANSIASAVIYWSDQPSAITFVNDRYPNIEYEQHSAPTWNSATWRIEPKRGDLIVFPSWLQHQVDTNNSTEERISISFNTWPRGTVSTGYDSRLTL